MKCKFKKICPYANDIDRVCNISGGMYYADETQPAGCWFRLQRAKEKGKLKEEIKEMENDRI